VQRRLVFKAIFGNFLCRLLEERLKVLRFGFRLQKPIKGNKVDRLGLFEVDCEFKLVDLKFIQSVKTKFLFHFSLLMSCYFCFLLF